MRRAAGRGPARPRRRRTPRRAPSRGAGQPLELRVLHRRQHDAVVAGQDRQHRQQPLLDRRRLERREQDDERPLAPERLTAPARPGQSASAITGSRSAIASCSRLGRRRARPPSAAGGAPAGRRPRSRPGRRRGRRARQQQRGVHRRVEPRHVLDPPGRRARGVEHQHHPPVPLGLPGADHDVAVAGAGPPVDRAYVVAADVLAQRVELRALAAHPHRRPPVQVAQPGEPADGRCLRESNGGSDPHRARRRRSGALPGRQPERPDSPHGHADGAQVAAPGRAAAGSPAARGRRGRAGRRCRLSVAPAVGCHASRTSTAQRAARRCSSTASVRSPRVPERGPGPGRRSTESERGATRPAAGPRRPARRRPAATATPCTGRAQQHGHQPQQEQQRDAPGDRHGDRRSARDRDRAERRRRAPRRRRRPRARPRAAARAGARASACASAFTSSGVTKSRPVARPRPGRPAAARSPRAG